MSEAARLDPGTLHALTASVGEDRAFVADVIGVFLADAPGLLDQMAGAARDGDAALLRRLAHGLKSNAASLGAMRMAGLLRDLEGRAAAGAASTEAELVACCREELDAVAPLLAAHAGGPRG